MSCFATEVTELGAQGSFHVFGEPAIDRKSSYGAPVVILISSPDLTLSNSSIKLS